MVSAGSDATGCQARACVTISAFVAPGRQRSMWRASVSTIQYSGTPSSLYSLRLCSRSVRLLEYDTTSTMSAGGPYSRAAVQP